MTTPLVAGTVVYREFFGGVLSDHRSPGRVGRPAGVDLVGTCAGDGKVEIYDMLCPRGTRTPSMFRGDDVCSDVMLYICQPKWETSARLLFFFVFLDKAYSLQLAATGTRARGMGHYQRVIRTEMLRHGTPRLRFC